MPGTAPPRIGSPPRCCGEWAPWTQCWSHSCARNRRSRSATCLRIGAAGLLLLETPEHAAVATAVALAKRRGLAPFAGLVNAVLRKVATAGSDALGDLNSARLDTPAWLWTSWGSVRPHHRFGASNRGTAGCHPEARNRLRPRAACLLPTGSVRFPAGTPRFRHPRLRGRRPVGPGRRRRSAGSPAGGAATRARRRSLRRTRRQNRAACRGRRGRHRNRT